MALRIQIIEYGGFEVQVKQFSKICSEALEEAVKYWHTEYLPDHFNRAKAYQKYSEYTRRKPRTIKRKKGKGGDAIHPLVSSGNLKNMVTSRLDWKPMKTKASGWVVMTVPDYVKPRKKGSQVNMKKELTARNRYEDRKMFQDIVHKYVVKKLNELNVKRVQEV